jgi:hypothetical protein
MAGWEDIALTLGNPMYPQLSSPGGPLQDMNGWQKAMLGIGMLGSLMSNMGNMGVVGRRKGIGGMLASVGPALAATQQQAMQAAGQAGRPAQAPPRAAGGQNRTRAWMESNAEGLGLSPDEIAGMDPAELVQRFWQVRGARGARPGGSAGRTGSVPRRQQSDHGNRITRAPRTFPESWFPWPGPDDGLFERSRPRFGGGLLPEPPLLPPVETNPPHPWHEPLPDIPWWRWPIDRWPYDDPDYLIPHLPRDWVPHLPRDWRPQPEDHVVPLPDFPRRWPGLLELPLADTEA